MQRIYEISLKDLARANCFELGANEAQVKRFRLIDCEAFTEAETLSIVECDALEHVAYSAISYVWRSNTVTSNDNLSDSFSVLVSDDDTPGAPISIDVLRAACRAALPVSSYIWLDQLCILQKSKEDRSWQISHMHEIYQKCRRCIIMPAGLQRLARLDEETNWILRAWTLQEALCSVAYCLFEWTLGTCKVDGLTTGTILAVENTKAGLLELNETLQAATTSFLRVQDQPDKANYFRVAIFGQQRAPVLTLLGAMKLRTQEAREAAIWRSALMRTSSRPIDMIFSIMGLFDVTLDPSAYGENERGRATVDLARAVIAKGGGATWLLSSLNAPPLRDMQTMPSFPETSVDGDPEYLTSEGPKKAWDVVGADVAWTLINFPRSTVNACGKLVISTLFSALSTLSPCTEPSNSPFDKKKTNFIAVRDNNGKIFTAKSLGRFDGTHAAIVRKINHYQLSATAARATRYSTVAMLVAASGEHWRRTGWLQLTAEDVVNWPERQVVVI